MKNVGDNVSTTNNVLNNLKKLIKKQKKVEKNDEKQKKNKIIGNIINPRKRDIAKVNYSDKIYYNV